MSRLDFAPKIDEIKITDIQNGIGHFTPRPDQAASFAVLHATIKKAGYTLASAVITVTGRLTHEDSGWWIVVEPSQQRFALTGQIPAELTAGSRVELTGEWQTEQRGTTTVEVIKVQHGQKVAAHAPASRMRTRVPVAALSLTPIRTTSPGLTVYHGGAVVPRYSFTSQHLGELKVTRQAVRLVTTYTPTSTLQLETDIAYQGASFAQTTQAGHFTGSGQGFGNLTVWGKYRFFRTLQTWGDKQAAFRFGLELPTGRSSTPSEAKLAQPAFVREQLAPINGGLSPHAEVSYSQARGRFVYGSSLEGIWRSERNGFHLGNEVRLNTDLEYILLPLKYRSPTNELFLILESTLVARGRDRAGGLAVPGSSATEFYLAPALQYVASARFLLEASYQFPVARKAGPLVLRTDRNVLIGVRFLY